MSASGGDYASGPAASGTGADRGAQRGLTGTVLAVCLGPGGIPKPAVEMARVSVDGLEGDRHRARMHGGQHRAVCLFSIEDYRSLQRDGVVCEPPGTFGENVLTEGLDFARLNAGDELAIGDFASTDTVLADAVPADAVRIALHDVREPCGTLKSVDRRFPDLMVGRSGFVCRVVNPGVLRAGMSIARIGPG